MLARMWRNWTLIVGGNAKGYRHSGKEFDNLLNKQAYTYYMNQPPHSWAFIPAKWLYMFVHSSFICNSQNWKQSKCLNNRWVAKHSMICPYHMILLLSNKKVPSIGPHNSCIDLKSIRLSEKKLISKCYSMIPFI